MGHLRRKRAGMRTGLVGGSNAEGEEGPQTVDDVGDSVGSADALQEDALIVVKEEAEDSGVVAVVVEESPEASWLFLFSVHRCKWGRFKAGTPFLGERWASVSKDKDSNLFTEQSSDIVRQ